MGQEKTCRVDFGTQTSEGKALLETNEIVFRGDFRLKISLKEIKILDANEGMLKVVFPEGTAVFHLGNAAKKWAERIQHPPSRLDKLGVKEGMKVSVLGTVDSDFLAELEKRGARFAKTEAELVFLAAEGNSDLSKLARIRNGAVWVIYPKGRKSVTQNMVLTAGREAGLVDVKVVGFSPSHTALKFILRKQ